MRFSTIFFLLLISALFYTCKKEYRDCRKCSCADLQTPSGSLGDDSVKVFVPKAFTPNGDGINDVFGPVCDTSKIHWMELKIYDEDNKKNYFSSTQQKLPVWNGKINNVAAGSRIFSWRIKGETKWGNSFSASGQLFLNKGNCFPKSNNTSCTFSDQIDLERGFILPTQEAPCK